MENSHFLMLQLMSHLSYPSCQVMKTTTSVHSGLLWKCGATTLPPIHNYTHVVFPVHANRFLLFMLHNGPQEQIKTLS